MDTNSKHNIESELQALFKRRKISDKYQKILRGFYTAVKEALQKAHQPIDEFCKQFSLFLHLVEDQFATPFPFEPYHRKIREPIDYYRFSLNFVRPLIDLKHSSIAGLDIVSTIEEQLNRGENAILLANHQTEPDPQVIAIMLEKSHPLLAEKLICVAGERVVTDPLAIPFSMGCDLLCIYSKRYIDHPQELKEQKQLHNRQTMERMSRLLAEGGKLIYVAPSGGRDRRNTEGQVEVAHFDPASLEMFSLMARKAKTPTHFYPLALSTYDLMPPPEGIQRELGEERRANFTPVHLSFLPEFDMEKQTAANKELKRKLRADTIWNIVKEEYKRLQRAH